MFDWKYYGYNYVHCFVWAGLHPPLHLIWTLWSTCTLTLGFSSKSVLCTLTPSLIMHIHVHVRMHNMYICTCTCISVQRNNFSTQVHVFHKISVYIQTYSIYTCTCTYWPVLLHVRTCKYNTCTWREAKNFIFYFQVGNIQEFDSLSSESSEATPTCSSPLLHPSPPAHLHTSTPTPTLPHRPLTIRDFPKLACPIVNEPTPEYLSIATPPSSPDTPTAEESSNKTAATKTGSWIRQISRYREDCLEETVQMNETAGPLFQHGSDSGRRGRGRGGKVVSGGLEEGLLQLIQREDSDVTFWEHCSRRMGSSGRGIYIVHVYIYTCGYFFFFSF